MRYLAINVESRNYRWTYDLMIITGAISIFLALMSYYLAIYMAIFNASIIIINGAWSRKQFREARKIDPRKMEKRLILFSEDPDFLILETRLDLQAVPEDPQDPETEPGPQTPESG